MTLTISIGKPLGTGCVQVDAAEKNGYTRYYKVPNKKAKKFASELYKQDKNLNLYSNITFFASIFTGVLGAYYFTKKLDSGIKQFAIQTASAIVLATLSSIGFNKYAQNQQENMLKHYGAKEIFYK